MRKEIPEYKVHGPSGRAFLEVGDQRHYLGKHADPASRRGYDRFIAEWLADCRRPSVARNMRTVAEVADAFMEHAKGYYRKPGGEPTTGYVKVRSVVQVLTYLYGDTPACEFSPMRLRAVREFWIRRGLSRNCINNYVPALRSVFRWAASHELVSVNVYAALQTVEALKPGRCEARETAPVAPVPLEHVTAIKPYVSRQVWTVVQVQLKTAARPSELLGLRPCDIDRRNAVWEVHLAEHKTAHSNRPRVLYIGPSAQRLLKPFLRRDADAFLFSPREAETERYAKCRVHRHQPVVTPSTDRKLRDHYDAFSYGGAIGFACVRAGVPHWTPSQLRHTAATAIRREFGLEVAQVILGHAHAFVSEIYAEADRATAIKVISRVG